MIYSIYLVVNTVNGKKYVGQTKGKVSRRWTNHKSSARRGQDCYFYRAIRKHGHENFKLFVLELSDTLEQSNDAERFWIKYFDTTNDAFGYNGLIGGAFQPTPETGRKISEGKLKSFAENPELKAAVIKAISEARSGIPLSEEHRDNISEGLKKSYAEGRRKSRKGVYKPSEETKAKTRESMKKAYAEGRHRKSEGLTPGTILGPMSEETKDKIREGMIKARALNPWSTKKKLQEPVAA
jgi:group I intron endonuclease